MTERRPSQPYITRTQNINTTQRRQTIHGNLLQRQESKSLTAQEAYLITKNLINVKLTLIYL